jgi:anti-sigma regulatory factor (Ser/Thr protein kinase)
MVNVPASSNRALRRVPAPVQLTLPRDVDAPASARSAVGALAAELELSRKGGHTLVLLVSEVVSNAVLHSTGPEDVPIGVSAAVDEDVVRVTVTDSGAGFIPTERDPARIEGGYGLYLVAKAASSWGVDPGPPTRVWFELPLDA